MLLYLDSRSYFEANGPNCFNVFLESTSAVNISSQDHFMIAKTGEKISQLERSRHIFARQPWIPNQKNERFMTEAKLQRCSLLTMTSHC